MDPTNIGFKGARKLEDLTALAARCPQDGETDKQTLGVTAGVNSSCGDE